MNTLKENMTTNQNYYSHTLSKIKNEDVYKDFRSDKEMFDFSNYPTTSKHYDN